MCYPAQSYIAENSLEEHLIHEGYLQCISQCISQSTYILKKFLSSEGRFTKNVFDHPHFIFTLNANMMAGIPVMRDWGPKIPNTTVIVMQNAR